MKHELIQSDKSYQCLQPLMDEVLEVRYTNLDRDLEICKELLAIAEREDYHYGKAFALTYLGDYYIAQNNGHKAKSYLTSALSIAKEQNYTELLLSINIFLGIYYDMMLDLFMSLNCTLEALELAAQLKDRLRESVIMNNIANIFENFGDMAAAKSYYCEALNCLEEDNQSIKNETHYALLLANLVHLCCYFKEVEEAKRIVKKFDGISLRSNDNLAQKMISLCHLSALQKDIEQIRIYTDQLIDLLETYSAWEYQFFEILFHAAKYMLEFKDQEYAYKILNLLNRLAGEDDPGNQLRVQNFWVEFYEKFGPKEQLDKAYKRYYELKKIVDITNNKTMAQGLHAKISLREVQKQQKEMQKVHKQLEKEAQYDGLTKLYNRHSFTRFIEKVVGDDTVHGIGIVMIDVDYFKQYNDNYGHAKGDDVLGAVAECMTEAANKNKDIFNFRYGGDEFVSLYLNCNRADLINFVRSVSDCVRGRNMLHHFSKCADMVTLSMGYHIGIRSSDGELDVEKLLEQADKALYRSKEKGRNTYSGF